MKRIGRLWVIYGTIGFGCTFASSIGTAQITFTEITEGSLVEDVGHFSNASWADFDGDGDMDVAIGGILNDSEVAKIRLFMNTGEGVFNLVTDGVLRGDTYTQVFPYSVDIENDGDVDLVASIPGRSGANVLYLNSGDGTFEKVTGEDWLTQATYSQGIYWGDFDQDGYLDPFICRDGTKNLLYRNSGDGSMETVPWASDHGESHGACWTDYDNDGDLDLFVSGQSYHFQYRNDGPSGFTWVSPVNGGIPSPSAWEDVIFISGDYDNDGDFDLLHILWDDDVGSRLYRNDLEGGFVDVSYLIPQIEPGEWVNPISADWGDYDNDGYLDLIISERLPDVPNYLFHNEGDGTFTRVMDGAVATSTHNSSFPSWVDYDNDGDLDLFVTTDIFSETQQSCSLFRNEGNANNWLFVDLVGMHSNRFAIGAKVWVEAIVSGQPMTQVRELHSDRPHRAHFGLGDATVIDRMQIDWPSGGMQVLHDVPVNQFLTIEQLTWAGHPMVNAEMDANTEGFMGWINVFHGDWIWCYAMNGWMYCPEENVHESGAWVYVPQ